MHARVHARTGARTDAHVETFSNVSARMPVPYTVPTARTFKSMCLWQNSGSPPPSSFSTTASRSWPIPTAAHTLADKLGCASDTRLRSTRCSSARSAHRKQEPLATSAPPSSGTRTAATSKLHAARSSVCVRVSSTWAVSLTRQCSFAYMHMMHMHTCRTSIYCCCCSSSHSSSSSSSRSSSSSSSSGS